ncbi:MAG: DNA translocase FtsK 4TM domain-containing protein [Gammaproteobacteria bacterium]|nr:DNA translocase FtsK 4TM domain-containing protein [Gammaproteobacteria bacterium]MDH5801878.1 DNA translocase FtsK 4TM domain-containing protein [Gammaproteobacteria bacterium]
MIRGLKEAALIVFWAVALYMSASLITYTQTDPGWSHSDTTEVVANAGGPAGAWFADVFLYLFGYMAYLFPIMVAYTGWLIFAGRNEDQDFDLRMVSLRFIGFVLTLCAGTGLATLHFQTQVTLPLDSGGILGDVVAQGLVGVFNFMGGTLLLIALFLTGISLFTSLSWIVLMDKTGAMTLGLLDRLLEQWYNFKENWATRRAKMEREQVVKEVKKARTKRLPPLIEALPDPIEESERAGKERQIPLFESDSNLPSLSLLDVADAPKNHMAKAALEAISRQVELKLKDFNIEVQVVAVHPGPVVTSFELEPAPGIKVSQISNLSKDLARSLSAISVRVVEVIPGKSTVGLEVPNEVREVVRLSEVLKSKVFDKARSPLSIALGKNISGHPVIVDLAKMPHLLVAGTTGSGKSVGLNAMVLSLLYNSTPNEVRMIMIDPKMLELSVYEGIPHLLAPVVTDMKQAANALRWCVAEMERRYTLMALLGVRNLNGYNTKVSEAIQQGEPIVDPTYKPDVLSDPDEVRHLEPLPYLVVVVDELADLMMVVGKKVEELIARLAQKARAAGMHLILATQRPSVDVLTGLIKANIPTRIAFQVSAKVDSRTILDQGGAEQLLGHGDMLYLAPGTGIPTRVHGAFVSDHEVHRVVKDVRSKGAPEYIEDILEGPSNSDGGDFSVYDDPDQVDELYDQAVAFVTETRKASISSVQRRLRIGYNRAARMVEEMERAGVVSSTQANGTREVLAPPPPSLD